MHGAQMVVSNVQGCDNSRWFMHGMFRANDEALPSLCTRAQMMGFFYPKKTLVVTKTLKVKAFMANGCHLDFNQTPFDSFSPQTSTQNILQSSDHVICSWLFVAQLKFRRTYHLLQMTNQTLYINTYCCEDIIYNVTM
ncbi:phosphoinositide phospholipase C 6-like isoform X2 [Rosa rugosa]|uniref:phosphoinositide phospholipase C 6-like isoform X2 n=1 Tax=Rosa rugosa TaxID=74645 RepID=UPI002B40D500|nr:phosphoinositide phospholipase C 6-like isoform X2 [Rosa rugosa]XP_062002095.1 phosphoinositide phospholipase C 6-like isoform X2 [Rosa rugosa]XP_062015968.1 phosphoinositide phospholipase C 6-like isoform X2 [Rosa rugosa]